MHRVVASIALVAACTARAPAEDRRAIVVVDDPVPTTTACAEPPSIALVDVRREPRAIVAAGGDVYWVDGGAFVDGDARHVRDGALWRMPGRGGAPTSLHAGLSVPSDLVIANEHAYVADADREHGGVLVVPLGGGRPRWAWRGPAARVAVGPDAIYVVETAAVDTLLRVGPDGTVTRLASLTDARALVTSGPDVLVAGATDAGGARLGRVTGRHARWLDLERADAITSLAAHAGQLHVTTADRVVAISGDAARTRGRAPDEARSVIADADGVAWIATADRRFALVAGGARGDVRLVDRPMIGWLLAADPDQLYWVESTPVADPWTKAPTPYRIGHVARRCH